MTSPGKAEPSRRREEWFAPLGEGYCAECRFIIPLDERGLLGEHSRGLHARESFEGPARLCPRSRRRPVPASRAPREARRSRFQYEPPTARCPECLAVVRTSMLSASYRPFYLRHPRRTGYGDCPMAGHEVRK